MESDLNKKEREKMKRDKERNNIIKRKGFLSSFERIFIRYTNWLIIKTI